MCSTNKRESKSIQDMDISANTSEVKDTKDEEPLVTGISLIKAAESFKQFKCNE